MWNEVTPFLTLRQSLFFPGCSLEKGNQALGPLRLFSHSRNNETKIHTKVFSLYSIYTFSCSQIWRQTMM